jgi:hypothetical protein
VKHHGEPIRLTRERTVTRPVPPARERTRPSQPPGREPRERRRAWAETA